MIKSIHHWVLTHAPSVIDEEALSALELVGRVTAKVNEVVSKINENSETLEKMVVELPASLRKVVEDEIYNGTLGEILSVAALKDLGSDLDTLNRRIDQIVAQAGTDNTEIVDARTSSGGVTFASLRSHLLAIENGSALNDAVRPGTVKAGRITSGMLAGDIRDKYTARQIIPMAGHWSKTGYYDPDTLALTAHSGYYISDPLPVSYGDVFLVTSYIYGPSVYPVALLDEYGQCIKVDGINGDSTWDSSRSEVHISRSDIKFIQFLCGTSHVANFQCLKIIAKENPDIESAMMSKGYIHTMAKKRTDTVTDRAQMRVWFEVPNDRTDEGPTFYIPVQLLKWYNLAGYTFRLFGCVSDTTYDMSLPESAVSYQFTPGYGICPYFTVPLKTDSGEDITHVCLFLDLIPARENEAIQIFCPHLTLRYGNGNEEPGIGYSIHGGLTTDHISVVNPGAMGRRLYGQTILGIGDSLMAGNGLPRSITWFDIMAGSKGMVWHNAGVNGRAIGGDNGMAANIAQILEDCRNVTGGTPDIVILQGGANDLRLSVSLEAFAQAIMDIVDAVLAENPHARIMLCTNWRRSDYVNTLGLNEGDYVAEMLRMGEELAIPVVNNYIGGLDLTNEYTKQWADNGYIQTGIPDLHFSPEANRVIADQIGVKIEEV